MNDNYKKYLKSLNRQEHPFHLVTPSPWPICVSASAFYFTTSVVMYLHYFNFWTGLFQVHLSLFFLSFSLGFWFRDIVIEATYQGQHTAAVRRGLRMGFKLFIVSEIMLFVSFFWALFHISLNPGFMGWPPKHLPLINVYGIPLLNTFILIGSGVHITIAHRAMVFGDRSLVIKSLFTTILYGLFFLSLQFYEYCTTPFSLRTGFYGSIFFMLTGLHGFHVIIGIIFLMVCFYRHINYHFTKEIHLGFEFAIWYWHFVDIVWILVYFILYLWGSQ